MLSDLRVLDLTDEKGLVCGKILGDLGADVIRIEPPGGCSAREIGPFHHNISHPEMSLHWFAYNRNKRGITLNVEMPEGQEILKKLAVNADLLVESFQVGYLDRLGLGYQELSKNNAQIVVTSITHFGQEGPNKDLTSCDLVDMAMGGMLYVCGDADRAPVRIGFPQAYLHGGATAAVASLIALTHCESSGMGQHVDVSIQECVAWTYPDVQQFWDLNKMIAKRAGAWRIRPATGTIYRHTWACQDGYVSFWLIGGAAGAPMLQRFVRWMDNEGAADTFLKQIDWDEFDFVKQTQANLDRVSQPIAEFFKTHTKRELYEGALKWRVWLYPVNTPEDIMADPQLSARDFWEDVYHPELDSAITYPGSPIKASEYRCETRRRAPLIGEHNREIFVGELGFNEKELVTLAQRGVI